MDTEYSDLELALNTLVTEFHEAAGDRATMNATQFQTMISNQLPSIAETLEVDGEGKVKEEAVARLLQQMEVESGEDISFQHFWKLINDHAIQVFSATYRENDTKCTCVLQ